MLNGLMFLGWAYVYIPFCVGMSTRHVKYTNTVCGIMGGNIKKFKCTACKLENTHTELGNEYSAYKYK